MHTQITKRGTQQAIIDVYEKTEDGNPGIRIHVDVFEGETIVSLVGEKGEEVKLTLSK